MNSRIFVLGVSLFSACFLSQSAFAQSSAFTYQGRLLGSNGVPASGNYDLQFKLRTDIGGSNQIGTTLVNPLVGVTNGLFLVTMDFGAAAFDGTVRYLEIGVRTNGSVAPYDILSPVQPLTSTPYALRSAVATTFPGLIADSQLSTNIPQISGHPVFPGLVTLNNGTGTFSGTLGGTFNGAASGTFNGGITATGTFNGASSGTFTGNGGGLTNLNVTNLVGVVQGNFNWQLVQGASQQATNSNDYLTTNAAQTTLILPPSSTVGNTLRISGSGAGGWVLGQAAGQSILTGNLGLPAGRSFTTRATNLGSLAWRGIASSSDGLKLLAAVNVGPLYTSVDGGQSWTVRASSLGNVAWQSVASSADGTRLVAAANGAPIYTSSDSGSNWTARGTSQAFYSVACSADGTKLVAVVNNGFIFTSVNLGTNWTQRGITQPWVSVCSSADGTKLAAAANGGQIFTSTDSGVTWVAHGPTTTWSGITSSSDGTELAAVANLGSIYTSGDSGVNWTARTSGSSVPWQTITSSGDGQTLVAAANTGLLYSSFDSGQTWTSRTVGNQAWYASAFSADGTRVAAVVNNGVIYTSASATTVGTGGSLVGGQYSSVELQYIGSGQWMPLNSSGKFIGN